MSKQHTNKMMVVKNVTFLFFLVTPGMNGKKIFEVWLVHPVLKEYERPDERQLAAWVEEFAMEKNSYGKEYIKI